MDVVVFHSMWGLRPVEVEAAQRLRSLGYQVFLPDLFDGRTAPAEIEAGFALMEEIGWSAITGRANDALARVAEDAVLMGFSMGRLHRLPELDRRHLRPPLRALPVGPLDPTSRG